MTTLRRGARSPAQLLQLKIELLRIKPLIWRRVLVPETITLGRLHKIIQAAMGWTDSHLHEFEVAGARYGVPDPEDVFGEPLISEARAKLMKSLEGMTSLRYVYDFGDDWEHRVKVEKVLPGMPCPYPIYLGGANACPPEDVGGPYGYSDFLLAITDPKHREHTRMAAWNGGPFDPAFLDHDLVQARLADIKF